MEDASFEVFSRWYAIIRSTKAYCMELDRCRLRVQFHSWPFLWQPGVKPHSQPTSILLHYCFNWFYTIHHTWLEPVTELKHPHIYSFTVYKSQGYMEIMLLIGFRHNWSGYNWLPHTFIIFAGCTRENTQNKMCAMDIIPWHAMPNLLSLRCQ